jgi:hypothetical protein
MALARRRGMPPLLMTLAAALGVALLAGSAPAAGAGGSTHAADGRAPTRCVAATRHERSRARRAARRARTRAAAARVPARAARFRRRAARHEQRARAARRRERECRALTASRPREGGKPTTKPKPLPQPTPTPTPTPTPAPADPAPSPAPADLVAPGSAALGISATLRWLGSADQAATLSRLREAGVRYVREDFHWNLVESTRGTDDWSRYDRLIRETAKHGISVVAIPNAPPSWATASSATAPVSDPALAAFTSFVRRAIARYGSTGTFWAANPDVPKVPVTIWDIWNEPWGTWAWKPTLPDGGAYARMFKAVVAGARSADPNARFMAEVETFANGHATPTSFIHAMFDAVPDLASYMDMVSHHPYPELSPPTQCRRRTPSAGVYEDWKSTIYDFCRVQDVRSILDARGAAATKLWITEVGFSTAPAGERTVTEAEQAQYVRDVFRLLRSWRIADGLIWYHYKTSEASPAEREDWFGLVHSDGRPKPAWTAFTEELRAGL